MPLIRLLREFFIVLSLLCLISSSVAQESIAVKADRFYLSQKLFVPVGVNYIIQSRSSQLKTFGLFDNDTWDKARLKSDFASIRRSGFNVVRIWLKGADPETSTGWKRNEIPIQYTDRVVEALRIAKFYNLHVVLAGPIGKYGAPTSYIDGSDLKPDLRLVGPTNAVFLQSALADALGLFYRDLLLAMAARDPEALSTIFYIDLYNEAGFSMREPPFLYIKGSFTRKLNAYDMGLATDRQKLMDDAARDWIAIIRDDVRAVALKVLITASSFFNAAMGRDGFDGGKPIFKTPSKYPLRPSAIVDGGADIIDVHAYPSLLNTRQSFHERFAAILRSNEIDEKLLSAKNVALVAGELGALHSHFSNVDMAAAELKSTLAVICHSAFRGYIAWMWSGTGDTLTLDDPELDRVLSPRVNQDINSCFRD